MNLQTMTSQILKPLIYEIWLMPCNNHTFHSTPWDTTLAAQPKVASEAAFLTASYL